MSNTTKIMLSLGGLTTGLFLTVIGCGPQIGVIDPSLLNGASWFPYPVPTQVPFTPTPTSGTPSSVVILSSTSSVAPTNANPPVTQLASYTPLQANKQINITVTAQLATSRLGIQVVQTGTTTVLANNLSPTSSTTTLSYTPSTVANTTLLVNDTINPGTLQSINVQVTQAL